MTTPLNRVLLAAAVLLLAEPALALRCQGKLIKEGDPQAKVLNFCGDPVSTQQRVIYRSGVPNGWVNRQLAVEGAGTMISSSHEELLIHDRSVEEILVEEWTYNLGPHRLMRVVRFENGIVAEVDQLGYGYTD